MYFCQQGQAGYQIKQAILQIKQNTDDILHYFEIAPSTIKLQVGYTHTAVLDWIISLPSVKWEWLVAAELAASETAWLV